jgi:amidase
VRRWQAFLRDHPVALMPVSGELPFPDQLDVQSPEAFRRVIEAQLTQFGLPLMGLPSLAVATGFAAGTPVGVQLVAARYREDVLLDAGEAIASRFPPILPIDPVRAAAPP